MTKRRKKDRTKTGSAGKGKSRSLTPGKRTASAPEADFDEVLRLIDAAQKRAVAAVNTTLMELYWSIGQLIAGKIADEGWGKGTVESPAKHICRKQPNARGFSARNLWRMVQFYETYRDQPKLSPLVTEISWTHNLLIMSRCKRDEEREFYLRPSSWQQRKRQTKRHGCAKKSLTSMSVSACW